nr:plasminogen [Onthophagus taurus]
MNGRNLLLFAFYFMLHGCKCHKINNKMQIVRDKDIGIFSKSNVSNIFRDVIDPDRNTSIYWNWSPWTRCENCMQSRFKKCKNKSCDGKKIFEEKFCKKKRCTRKKHMLKSYYDMHIIEEVRESRLSTRTMVSKIWTKWSDWSPCSKKCRTKRYRTCKKPGRCKKRRQYQSAFCYTVKTICEKYVFHLIGKHKNDPTNKYVYDLPKQTINYYNKKKKCGRPFKTTKMLKIIGGTESEKNKWPWHVALQNAFNETFCGGTLIAPRWVLTAGHCLRKYLRVRFNEHDLTTIDGRERDLTVNRMFLHPEFNHVTVDNDIALLRLPEPVVQPVACLPSSNPIPKDLCYVMGWGKEKSYDILGTNTLKEAQLPVVNEGTCKRSYRNYIITDNMFCAGWKSGTADTCAGDSGGGLMCSLKRKSTEKVYVVQGITSFGDGCGRRNKYGIYTKVNNYLQWIQKTMDMYS